MASLQAYQSHGILYDCIVESFPNNGKLSIRVLALLGRVDEILKLHQDQHAVPFTLFSVNVGALTALHNLDTELNLSSRSNAAVTLPTFRFAMA